MILLYNNSDDTFKDLYRHPYENLDEYISPAEGIATVYDILFFTSITDIFIISKQRSAVRGRFAKDPQGNSLIESFAITDDEKDWFDNILPGGASEIFKKLSAFAKNVSNAYKYGVTFGGIVASGTVESVQEAIVTDSNLSLVPSALKGNKFVITSGAQTGEERLILDNTETTITLEFPWEQDITGLTYNVYNADENYILFTVKMDSNWDLNMLQNCESAIMEALISYALKEWYLSNRYLEDYTIEEDKYQKHLVKVKSSLNQGVKPYRRRARFFT